MTTSTTKLSIDNRLVRAFFLVATTLAIFVAFYRIHTFVTGQDPRTFIVLGRQIAEQGFSLAAIREVARFVIPGYPLALAAVIHLFSIEAVFWLNSFLLTGLCLLLNRLFFRIVKNEWQAGLMTLFCLTGLFAGFATNAHFLLYAFRNTPLYLSMTGALLCVVSAQEANGRKAVWLTLCAGLCLLFGIAIRETTVLIVPALTLFLYVTPRHANHPSRRAMLAAFLFPFIISGLICSVVFLLHSATPLNSQSKQFLAILPSFLDLSEQTRNFREMVRFVGGELGLVRIALLLFGLWHARKKPEWLCLFLLPALLYFALNGAIKVHRRFFLDTLFFMLPLSAYGLATLLAIWHRRPKAGRFAYPVTTLILAAWCFHTVAQLDVWGVKVTSDEIWAMTDILKSEEPEQNTLLVDGRTRHLIDALTVFTSFDPINPADPGRNLIHTPPLLFVQPMNKAAIHSLDLGLAGRIAIQRQGRLESTGQGFTLGPGEYELARVLPWTNRTVTVELSRAKAYPAVLEITAPQLWHASTQRSFIRLSLDGQVVMDHIELGANFAFIERPPTGTTARMVIESDAAIPTDFEPVWLRLDEGIDMDFGDMAYPSFDHYLSEEFFHFPSHKPDVRELSATGAIRLPVLYPSNTYLLAMLGANTVHHEPDVNVAVSFSSDAIQPAHAQMPASSRMTPMLVHLGVIGTEPLTHLELTFEREGPYRRPPRDERGFNYEVHNLILYPVPLNHEAHINIGERGDTPYIANGFWLREQSPSGSGRWTQGRARVNIFVTPGPSFELRISFQDHRPPTAPSAQPALSFNGRPLAFQQAPTGSVLIAHLPASWVTGPSNVLEITTSTWKPSAFMKTRDHRLLGLFINRVDLIPQESP